MYGIVPARPGLTYGYDQNAREARRKVEAAMARGDLRAIVCTSTLDMGIDWGDVDLVVNVGAPKGASRIMQRIWQFMQEKS